jgi:MFS family permease
MSKYNLFVHALATFVIHAIVIGNLFTFGTTLPIMVDELNATMADAMFVGSEQLGVFFFGAVFAIPLADKIGPTIPSACGAAIWFGGMYGFSTATTAADTFLYLGFLNGIGGSLAFWASLSQLIHLSANMKVVGAAMIGGGFGQVAFIFLMPLSSNWRSTYFAISVVGGVGILFASAFLMTPPPHEEEKNWRTMDFWRFTLSNFFLMFGYFIPYIILIVDAQQIGFGYNDANALIGYLACGAFIGRLMCVEVALFTGVLNAYRFFVFLTMMACFGWTMSTQYSLFVAFATFFGFSSGALLTLMVLQDAHILWMSLVLAPGAFASGPIVGVLDHAHAKIFATVMMFCALIPLCFIKNRKVTEPLDEL